MGIFYRPQDIIDAYTIETIGENHMSMLNGIIWCWKSAFNDKFDYSDTVQLIPLGYSFHLRIPIFARHKSIEVELSIEEAEQFGSYLLKAVKKAKELTIETKPKIEYTHAPEGNATNVEERMYGDVLEHKHPEYDYWHLHHDPINLM